MSFKKTFKTIGKLLAMLFPMVLALSQLSELMYDLGPQTPVEITSPDQLAFQNIGRMQFTAVVGEGDFEHAFVYKRYGISYTYFLVKPYGSKVVVRTYLKVTDDWKQLTKFLGKMQEYQRMPFSQTVRSIFKDKYDIDIPADAVCLRYDDAPAVSGWSVAALTFCVVLWCLMGYFFFIWRHTPATRMRHVKQDA